MNIKAICKTLVPGYDPFANCGECWFDDDAAQKAISFFPACLKHVEGAVAGKPFVLEPWQQSVIGNLFGWYRKDNQGREVRRYRECLLYVPRKNGKTPLIAGLGAYVFFCDAEKGQQDYIAAADREQAGMLFRHLKGMVEQEPEMSKRCRIYGGNASAGQSRSIVRESDGSFLRVVSADADTKHGGNPHLIVIDELHAQPDAELYDVLHTGMASQNRAQPLFICLTTADYDRPSVCNERHDYACRVRDGLVNDQTFLPVIFETLPEDDWKSPDVWAKANPNLGVSVSLDYLKSECEKAQQIPRLENTFKRLHLNIRTQNDERWLSLDAWDESDYSFDPESLLGKPCWCGLDLSTTTDLSAFVMVFHRGLVSYDVLTKFWIPEENSHERSKRDHVDYDAWINSGILATTPGNSIDYDIIRRDINDLGRKYEIREIAADRWNATQIIGQLDGDGHQIFAFGQGFKDMTAPCKELERAIMAGNISANKNPIMRWMIGNVATDQDAAGNIKPTKAKSTERIDGVVAMIMGIGRAMLAERDGADYGGGCGLYFANDVCQEVDAEQETKTQSDEDDFYYN